MPALQHQHPLRAEITAPPPASYVGLDGKLLRTPLCTAAGYVI